MSAPADIGLRGSGTAAAVEPCGMMHVGIIARLHADFMADAWNADAFATLLATPGTFGFLASADGVPTGFVLCRAAARECEILTIGVAPHARGRGIGGRLLETAIRQARHRGLTEMFLEVGAGNQAARRLYESREFSVVGNRPAYYRHAGRGPEDALILRLLLDPPGN
ncbi:MAG: ribosomal protein S18-alanine N-acetyltransferase [Rhodospirillales bacterium]|nr:ribosomal protein S18-alanine N-acetyltransferase [Rhodospirillales bacterium]